MYCKFEVSLILKLSFWVVSKRDMLLNEGFYFLTVCKQGMLKTRRVSTWNFTRNWLLFRGLCQFILCDYRSHVTVDEQTLIAQIGGILGITHGWSGKTFFVELFDTMLTVASFYIPLL